MDILEGNKLIADFMGFDRVVRDSKLKGIKSLELYIKDGRNYMSGEISYNSSWDWLMGAVEKIEELAFHVKIDTNYCVISSYNPIVTEFNTTNKKIEMVYRAVVAFIQWYNSQSK